MVSAGIRQRRERDELLAKRRRRDATDAYLVFGRMIITLLVSDLLFVLLALAEIKY
jgi:hypothetical protein